jgi:hypothetical protein
VGASAKDPDALAMRSRIVLGAADGETDAGIAARVGVHRNTLGCGAGGSVSLAWMGYWTNRVRGSRARSPTPRSRRSSPKMLESALKNATHWSARSMAQEIGLTQTAVSRIRRAFGQFGLQPHRQQSWHLSKDPN